MEDHDAVLKVVCEILERKGFRVLRAASGAEAIQPSAFRETIHLLLSDVMMADMSGPVCQLQKRRPEMRVMMMSGYPAGDMLFLNQGWHFNRKAVHSLPVGRQGKRCVAQPGAQPGHISFRHSRKADISASGSKSDHMSQANIHPKRYFP